MNTKVDVEQFMTRESFGKGYFLGNNPGILDLSSEKMVYVLAWWHACTGRREVINEYGLDWTLKRYAECNYSTGEIIDMARRKPFLYWTLTTSIRRESSEQIDLNSFEKRAVPDSHLKIMSPLSRPEGYALPRVLIEIKGRGSDRSPERYFRAIDMLEDAIDISSDSIQLLSELSKRAVNSGVDAKIILGHVLASGIMDEENCKKIYQEIIGDLKVNAPVVWDCYNSLSSEERMANGIINL